MVSVSEDPEMGHAEGLPYIAVEHVYGVAGQTGHAGCIGPQHLGHGLCPVEVVGAGEYGHVAVGLIPPLPDYLKGKSQVFHGGS